MKNKASIVIQQNFSVSRSLLWSYLTQLKHMQLWFFEELKSFEPVLGFQTNFAFNYEGKTFTHQWDIRELIPEEKLVLGWQYAEYEGDSTACFELKDSIQGCQLFLTASVLEPFPKIKEFSMESMKTGWSGLVHERLLDYVLKTTGN